MYELIGSVVKITLNLLTPVLHFKNRIIFLMYIAMFWRNLTIVLGETIISFYQSIVFFCSLLCSQRTCACLGTFGTYKILWWEHSTILSDIVFSKYFNYRNDITGSKRQSDHQSPNGKLFPSINVTFLQNIAIYSAIC